MAAPLADDAPAALADAQASLFEEPACLRALHEHAMPLLRTYPAPRVWLADCAHAEDTLAIAALLREHRLLERTQVFVSAPRADALARIRSDRLSPRRLTACRAAWRALGGEVEPDATHVRDGEFIWVEQALGAGASFSEFELIVCRRALCDFGPGLRARVLHLFAESLPLLGMLYASADRLGGLGPRFAERADCPGLYRRVA
ncbi:MAG TPA: hypothetical protein VM406_12805 [Noviherbaspirillum sp.]|nr:hypothetical protein [Noviherbaspirillum sp.]